MPAKSNQEIDELASQGPLSWESDLCCADCLLCVFPAVPHSPWPHSRAESFGDVTPAKLNQSIVVPATPKSGLYVLTKAEPISIAMLYHSLQMSGIHMRVSEVLCGYICRR